MEGEKSPLCLQIHIYKFIFYIVTLSSIFIFSFIQVPQVQFPLSPDFFHSLELVCTSLPICLSTLF